MADGATMATAAVTLNGRRRELRFTFNALARTEPYTGRPLTDVIQQMAQVRMLDLQALLWAGTLHELPRKLWRDRDVCDGRFDAIGDELQAHLAAGGNWTAFYGAINEALLQSGILGPRRAETSPTSGDEGDSGNAGGSATTSG